MLEKIIKKLANDDKGATATEYGLIAMLIAVAVAGIVTQLGDEVETQYDTVATEYQDANKAPAAGA